jgi:hypothetical protein
MSGEETHRPSRSIPAWLVPWCIPLLLVLFVVSAVVSPFLMLVPAAAALGAAARWRYLEVRQRELGGVHEWERWRTDAMLRRAADKYNERR